MKGKLSGKTSLKWKVPPLYGLSAFRTVSESHVLSVQGEMTRTHSGLNMTGPVQQVILIRLHRETLVWFKTLDFLAVELIPAYLNWIILHIHKFLATIRVKFWTSPRTARHMNPNLLNTSTMSREVHEINDDIADGISAT